MTTVATSDFHTNNFELNSASDKSQAEEVSASPKPERKTSDPIKNMTDPSTTAAPILQRANSNPTAPSSQPAESSNPKSILKPTIASSTSATIRQPGTRPGANSSDDTQNSENADELESGVQPNTSNPPSQPSSGEPTENDDEEWTNSELEQTGSVGDEDEELDQNIADDSKQVWALVKFSYDTDDPEELAMQPDEIIEILEQNDDGWWKGRNVFGKEGIFPHNFVVLTTDPSAVRASPITIVSSAIAEATISPSSPATISKNSRRSIFQKKKKGDDDHHGSHPSSPAVSHSSSPVSTPVSPIMTSSAGLPSLIRKNSNEKPKKDRRSQTMAASPPVKVPGAKAIPTSPSMPSLPVLPDNKLKRTPSVTSMHASLRTSDTTVAPLSATPPSPRSLSGPTTPTSAPTTPNLTSQNPLSGSTGATSAVPVQASPAGTPTSSPRGPSATISTAGPGSVDSFIMKVHIPPTGSSQFKVQAQQTVGDLLAMVAKKRMYALKDCSMRLPSASQSDPPIEPSTIISSLGTKELRLFLEGESYASLPSLSPAPDRPISTGSGSSSNIFGTVNGAGRGIMKEGYMMKADNTKKMKKTWITLDKNFLYFYKTSLDKNPTERISLYCATPKPNVDTKKKNTFDLLTVTNTYTFSADSEAEAAQWVNALQEACQSLIIKQISDPAAEKNKERKAGGQQHTRELVLAIRDLPENNTCAECSAPNPEWAAINLGIFFCIDCSGIHRSLGVHISQVRSVVLDHWDLSQVMIMETMGNKRANEFWEHTIPAGYSKPTPKSSIEEREDWIRAKYQQKQFIESSTSGFRPTPTSAPTSPTIRPNTPPTPTATTTPTPPATLTPLEPATTAAPSSIPSPTSAQTPASSPAPTPAPAPAPAPTPAPAPVPVPVQAVQAVQSVQTAQAVPVPAPTPSPAPTPAPAPQAQPAPTPAPTSAPGSPALSRAATAAAQPSGPQKIAGIDFVGYGFFTQDDPSRPLTMRRQQRLFKNTFDENRTVHVAVHNAPSVAWRDVEYTVVDHFNVDTSSVRGFIPATTKIFDKPQDYTKFLLTYIQPQLDSYRQTSSLQSERTRVQETDVDKWFAVTELRMELYELFVDQMDEEGLSPHVVKAAPLLAEGDPAVLAQFIKKNGTHFVRSGVYGGRVLMKTIIDKSVVPDKDEAIRLCQQNFKHVFDGEAAGDDLAKVQNFSLDITGGDNKKRGAEWLNSTWDRPMVLSYDLESISAVFDDLSLSVKVEAAANEHIEKSARS